MSAEIVRKFRLNIPDGHRSSVDTRIAWLWNQRFGTVQTIWQQATDPDDILAATIILQSLIGNDLTSIQLLFKRIEGGTQADDTLLETGIVL